MLSSLAHCEDCCHRQSCIASSNNDFETVHEVMENNWEEFFARIPMEQQRETRYAYEAEDAIDGPFPRGTTLANVLGNHPFGHLVAEWKGGIMGMKPIHVVHHIAYDNGDETSLITKHLGRVGCTGYLYALQGLGTDAKVIGLYTGNDDYDCLDVPTWEELLLFTIESFDDGTFRYNKEDPQRLHICEGIIALPPFMTLALTHANSSDPRVLLMAAVQAIRVVLENDVAEEDEIEERYRLMELEYIPQWLFLESSRRSAEQIRQWLDLHVCEKNPCWECVKGYSIPDPDDVDDSGIAVEWFDGYDSTSSIPEVNYNWRHARANQYGIALENNVLKWPLHFACGRGDLTDVRKLLNSKKVHVDDRNADGDTALMLALKNSNNWEVVRELITHESVDLSHVDLNVRGRFGYTVLMWATLRDELDIVSILLKHDALDRNLKNVAGSTALDIAGICGHTVIARLLQDTEVIDHGVVAKRMKMTPMIP
jgi:Ankyrin repeats (3 copies)